MADEMFSVEGLLDIDYLEVEDLAALTTFESQLMSCNVEHDHIDNSFSSSWVSLSGCPGLSAGADPRAAREPEEPTALATSSYYNHAIATDHSTGGSKQYDPPQIITFGIIGSSIDDKYYYDDCHDNWSGIPSASKRRASYAKEHVLVEKRRRQKLAQRFLDLTSLVPGLINKKMFKASVIEEAAKHIKQLQEQVKLLEQQMKEKTEEVAVRTQNIQASSTLLDEGSSSVNGSFTSLNPPIEISVTGPDGDILIIKIHAQLDYNLIQRIHGELEKLYVRVLSSNVMPTGKFAMDATVVAQIEKPDRFCMTAEHLVKHMRACIQENFQT